MTTINLKDYYPWYLTNEYIEVTDEVAEALMASKRAEAAHAERVRYNRAYYSLDCDDGIEYSACVHEPSPQELLDRKEMFFRLWNALNSLPELQGRRVDAHLILGGMRVLHCAAYIYGWQAKRHYAHEKIFEKKFLICYLLFALFSGGI